MYETIMPALYGIGILLSGIFVVTWFPLAASLWLKSRGKIALYRIADYAGLQLMVLAAFSMVLHGYTQSGVEMPSSFWASLGRVVLIAGIDVFVGLRLARWLALAWRHRHDRNHGDALMHGVSKQLEEPRTSP